MCLIVEKICHPNFKPLTAKIDIPCYKVLFAYEDSGSKKYTTPYMQTKVLNNILIADKFETNVNSYYKRVDSGIHSFQNNEFALIECNLLNTSLPNFPKTSKYIVKKAVIPKGAKYWIGKNDEYCSEKIIFKNL